MKKIIFAIALLAGLQVSAQYKKASFLNVSGRTKEFGVTAHMLGNGAGSPLGFYMGWGKEGENRFFRSGVLSYIPKYNFTIKATGVPSGGGERESIKISGARGGSLEYNFNYGYFVTDNSDEDKKLQGYVSLGTGFIIGGELLHTDDTYDNYREIEPGLPDDINFNINLHGSVGGIYKFTERFGLKLDVGYCHLFRKEKATYGAFKSHPYVSFGIRLKALDE